MKKDILALIDINRDAITTNRGFYYQYLSVLLKWINNYIAEKDIDVYTEVDDDIKEIGDELIFTQVKCYSSVFSFSSPEIKKALLNFFTLYLKYKENWDKLSFSFLTNSKISRNEMLLKRWIDNQPTLKTDIIKSCSEKISHILCEEIMEIRNKRLNSKKLDVTAKEKLISDFETLNNIATDLKVINDFILKIRWDFQETNPQKAIVDLLAQIKELLQHETFGNRPVKLLFDAMLSEIYRKSQLVDPEERKVNSALLKSILETKDDEIIGYVDNRFIKLFDGRINFLEDEICHIKGVLNQTVILQKEHGEILSELKSNSIQQANIPHLITRIPYIDPSAVIGREKLISDLYSFLNNTRHISINGNGGMGKSSFLKLFVSKFKSEYDHIIWINAEIGLLDSIIMNAELGENLNLPAMEPGKFLERFNQIFTKLNSISGNNLLIIDGYEEVAPEITILKSLENWKILLGTKLRIIGWQSFSIKALDFEAAKSLYYSFGKQDDVKDCQLERLFNYVEYNTLTIALVAKTICYSFDLTLEKVIVHFEEQSLDDQSLQINFPDEYEGSAHLLNIINKTFDLNKLKLIDSFYLSFFALLPLEETNFSDLVEWYGDLNKDGNKVFLTNSINSLHQKGLIERSGQTMRMHRMLRDSIVYQERQDNNAFAGHIINILNLINRIKEGSDSNFPKAIRFLRFGEAILKVISEPYRKSIYKPMLQLENEVLNVYNWLQNKGDILERWKDLFERSERHLSPNDELLGIISNNYGLVLCAQGNSDQAIVQFEKAISILQTLDERTLSHSIISLCNLCIIFTKKRDINSFKKCFNTINELREKHNLWNDVSIPVQSSVLAWAYSENGNFQEAINLLKIAINLHELLPVEIKNDTYLCQYLINIGICFIITGELANAEKAASRATEVLSELNTDGLVHRTALLQLKINIAEVKGDEKLAKILREELEDV